MKKDSLFSAFKNRGMEIPKNEQLSMKGGQGDPVPCSGHCAGHTNIWHHNTANEWQTEDSNSSTGWYTDCETVDDCKASELAGLGG